MFRLLMASKGCLQEKRIVSDFRWGETGPRGRGLMLSSNSLLDTVEGRRSQ